MPTYDYQCTKCGHTFEVFQSMTEPSLKTCPECAGKVKRLISGGSGLIFKGSGFYITDYKKSNSSTDGGSQTSNKSETSKSSSTDKQSKE
ncbi:MAG: FmdB family transcriptional regulator [Bacteroidales bacterium]|nr:FmdB family transcriptional regulator [Bacteroidales bacterium]